MQVRRPGMAGGTGLVTLAELSSPFWTNGQTQLPFSKENAEYLNEPTIIIFPSTMNISHNNEFFAQLYMKGALAEQ
jgi:hypothetical protein